MSIVKQLATAALGSLVTATLASACSGGSDPASFSTPADEPWFPISPTGGNPFGPSSSGSGCTPITVCAQTCGQQPDGCGGMLDCDNNMQDGGETDVDCGGSNTMCTRCMSGDTCMAGTDCASGFCADGVCCNELCDQVCESCGMPSAGSCQPIVPGMTDTNCMSPMACDGNGMCLGDTGAPCMTSSDCISGICMLGQCT